MTTVVDLVLGLILLATWVMLPLWTIEMLQIAHYLKNSGKQDPWYLKATIALVALADTGATCLVCEWAYTYAITNFGNMAILGVQGMELPAHNILVSFTACVCQVYLATRFYKISKNLPVYIGLLLLTAAAQISAIYISVIEVTHRKVSDRDLVINGAIIWLSCEAATDLGISVALVFYLVKFRVRTAFDDTKSMLTKLILVAVESGILTSLFAIATLVAAVAALQTNICLFFVFVLGRVYGCTLLYNLNIRKGGSLMGSSTFAKTGGSTNAQVNTYHLNALSRAEDLQGVTIERSTHVYVDAAEKDEPDSKATSRY